MAGPVTKNMIVRVGGDFSSLISGSIKASSATSSWARATKSAFSGMTSVGHGISSVTGKLGSLTSVFSTLGAVVAGLGLGALIKESVDAASDLEEVQNVVDKAFGSMSGQAEEFSKTAIQQFGLTELQAKQFSANFMAMGQSMGLMGQQAADMAIDLAGMAGDVASFYNIDQDEAYTKLKSIYTGETESLKELGVVMTEDNLKAYALSQGITTSYSAMSQGEKVALRYSYVMNALGYAQGDFADTAGSWANNVRVLKNQFTSLLAILGKGFIAVANPIVTTMNGILSTLISFANDVSEVFSSVFGTAKVTAQATLDSIDTSGLASNVDSAFSGLDTSDLAESVDDALGSVGDSAGDAAKGTSSAADELKRTIMGFDEISKLAKESSSSGSGSGGGSGSGSGNGSGSGAGSGSGVSFQTTEGTSGILSEWADKLREALEKEDFTEFGTIIGTKLKSALEDIDWNGVQEQCRKITKYIATFLNGFLETEGLGETIGNTVGEAIYTGLTIADTFAKTFHWESLGKFIGDGINGAVETLSSKDINFGSTIADLLNGAISGLSGFANTVKWSEVGDFISDNVNKFFTTFDGKKAGEAAHDLISGLTEMLSTAIENIDTSVIKEDIEGFLDGLDPVDLVIKVGELVLDLTDFVFDLDPILSTINPFNADDIFGNMDLESTMKDKVEKPIQTFLDNFTPNLDKFLSNFGDLESLLEAGKNIGLGLLKGVATALLHPHMLLESLLSGICDVFGIHSPASAPELLEAAGYIGEGILNGILQPFKNIQSWVSENILKPFANAIKNVPETTIEFTAKIKTSLSDLVKGFTGKAIEFAAKIDTSVSSLVSKFTGHTISFFGKVSTSASEIVSKFTGKTISFAGKISTSFAALVSKFTGKTIRFAARIVTTFSQLVKNFTGKVISFGAKLFGKATGGMYRNGHWSPVQAYAAGGSPNQGQMFIAREAGPELVGSIGSGTAVMNNDQIVASVSDGVYKAVLAAMSGSRGSGNQNLTVQVILDSKVAGEAFVNYLKGQAAQGNFPLAGLT